MTIEMKREMNDLPTPHRPTISSTMKCPDTQSQILANKQTKHTIMKRTLSLVALLTLGALNLTIATRVDAQVLPGPALMNFQGRLAKPDGTPVPDGTYAVTFRFFNAATRGRQLVFRPGSSSPPGCSPRRPASAPGP